MSETLQIVGAPEVKLPHKRVIDIRVQRMLTREEFAAIAMRVKSDYPNDVANTFIFYFLPSQEIGKHAAIATTHFRPELEVSIATRIEGI